MTKNVELKEVVVVLPYTDDKVLMQLRDFKEDIPNPGKWGFFGGGMEKNETPEESAMRETFEEIAYKPKSLHSLGTTFLNNCTLEIHAYSCDLKISIEDLVLGEGLDFGLFSIEEIFLKKLFSSKLNRKIPVISAKFIEDTLNKLKKLKMD